MDMTCFVAPKTERSLNSAKTIIWKSKNNFKMHLSHDCQNLKF